MKQTMYFLHKDPLIDLANPNVSYDMMTIGIKVGGTTHFFKIPKSEEIVIIYPKDDDKK